MIEFTKAAVSRLKDYLPPLFLCSFQVGRVAYLQIRCHQKALFCVLGSCSYLWLRRLLQAILEALRLFSLVTLKQRPIFRKSIA